MRQLNILNPMYIPLATTSFNSIHINLRNDAGQFVSFPKGSVTTVILHFKKTNSTINKCNTFPNYSEMDANIVSEYSQQSGSGNLPYFVGRQYGVGWLRNLAKFAFPLLRKAVGAVGNIAANTAQNMIENEGSTLGSALKKSASKEVGRVLKPKRPASSINKGRAKKRRTNTIFK